MRLSRIPGTGKQYAVFCLVLLVHATVASAAPEAKYFYPAGGQPGATVETILGGKSPQWPVAVHSSSPDVTVEPLEEKGKLKISVAEGASPGPVWLRVYDDTGAALPRPWIVDEAETVVETEPNDRPAEAQELPLDAASLDTVVVDGRLKKDGDVDVYRVELPAGTTLVANVDAHTELASPMDGVLQVLRPDGFVAAQNDDQHTLDPRLAVPIDHAGTWMVRVFSFPAAPNQAIRLGGDDDYVYRLTVTTGPVVNYAFPLAASRSEPTEFALYGWNLPEATPPLLLTAEPDQQQLRLQSDQLARTILVPTFDGAVLVEPEVSSPDAPVDVSLPASITGRIETDGEKDAYRFEGKKGGVVSVKVASRSLGYPVDPVAQLVDEAGKELARVDDVGANRDAHFTHTVAADGPLRVIVSDLFDHSGDDFVYRLDVEKVAPGFSLSSATHQVVVKPGEKAEIEIGVARRGGFSEPIEVAIAGLPAGVTATPQTSETGKDSKTADKVTLTVAAAEEATPGSAGIEILGKSESVGTSPARFDAPGRNEGLSLLWLTIAK